VRLWIQTPVPKKKKKKQCLDYFRVDNFHYILYFMQTVLHGVL
jgi:hypothetical protein